MSTRDAERTRALLAWLEGLGFGERLEPASGDASFRRYFRVYRRGESFIAMDAPPGKEDLRPFLETARAFGGIGLHVPEVHEADVEQGFALLEDLGTRTYLMALSRQTAERLYGDALGALAALQALGPTGDLPPYDEGLLLEEMALFRDWYLKRHLGLRGGEALEEAFAFLARSALEQPKVCVHRDFHSRNLMVVPRNNPGILDFQDAVAGPVTYDLVSL
ncbi:MAG: aminoglycoside phosphotransferase, partial [Gammaproteobacteria bacterium]